MLGNSTIERGGRLRSGNRVRGYGAVCAQPEFLEPRLQLASTLAVFNSAVSFGVTYGGDEIDRIDNLAVTGTIEADLQVDGAGNGTVAFQGANAALASGVFSIDFGFLGTASLTLQAVTLDLTSSAIATANHTFSFDGTDAELTFDGGMVNVVGSSGALASVLPPPGETINFNTDPTSVSLSGYGVTGTAFGNPPSVTIPLNAIAIPLDDVLSGLGVVVSGTIQAQGTAPAADSIGVYNPATATSFLRNSNSSGVADVPPFNYGIPNWVPISGDWNGDGTDTISVYNPSTATFFLRNSNTSGNADVTFNYGIPGWVPVAGDWDNDGTDTIGVYNPSTATFFLRNSNDSGVADATFNYGLPNWTPLAGDWNGDGTDTVGVFNAATATFFLRNANSSGPADIPGFNFGGAGWTPLAGDWNGDAVDTIGVVNPANATFYLRNVNLAGVPDITPFQYGLPGWVPLAGNWDGTTSLQGLSDVAVETIEFGVPLAEISSRTPFESAEASTPLKPSAVQSAVSTTPAEPTAISGYSGDVRAEALRTMQLESTILAKSQSKQSGESVLDGGLLDLLL